MVLAVARTLTFAVAWTLCPIENLVEGGGGGGNGAGGGGGRGAGGGGGNGGGGGGGVVPVVTIFPLAPIKLFICV